MNKLSDAPELKAAFNKAANDFGLSDHEFSRGIAEHFFIAGRDSLREECESVKPKRTIADIFFEGKDTYVLSNDGKLYHLVNEYNCWVPYPDLPQED